MPCIYSPNDISSSSCRSDHPSLPCPRYIALLPPDPLSSLGSARIFSCLLQNAAASSQSLLLQFLESFKEIQYETMEPKHNSSIFM